MAQGRIPRNTNLMEDTVGLKIIKAQDPIQVDRLIVTIYGPPGVGKTSLAFSADAPLLLDTDRGAYRSAYRGDSVAADTWADVEAITAKDVDGYRTLVLDTAGRALDLLSMDIIAKNPKMGRGGALTLQGYGELKSRFASYLKLMQSFGLDVVLVAHSDEKQQGDDIIERIDMQGSSKQEVYKSSDAMARLGVVGNDRILSFSPGDTTFGKDPASLGRVTVPDLSASPRFLGGLIDDIKSRLNDVSETQRKAAQEAQARAEEWTAAVGMCEKPGDFTQLVPQAASRAEKVALLEAARAKGHEWDAGSEKFVALEEAEA